MPELDPSQKIELFRNLGETLSRIKSGELTQNEGFNLLMDAATKASGNESGAQELLMQFMAGEISASMDGGYKDLSEYELLEPNSWKRKRIASLTWWYTEFRVDKNKIYKDFNPSKKIEYFCKRASFELGNNDLDSVQLLMWADKNPQDIASIMAQSMISGELTTFHIPLLGEFIKKTVEGTLSPLNFPTEDQ